MSYFTTDTPKISTSFTKAYCRMKDCLNIHVPGKLFCSACLQKPPSKILEEERRLNRLARRQTWIYFISIEGLEPIKIGRAHNVESRIKDLQIASPNKISLLAKFRGPHYAEYFLHNKYQDHHVRGEWFNPAPEILELIDQAKEGKVPVYLTVSKELMLELG